MTNPPRPGYWLANDGKWYPPELHPDRIRERLAAERDEANAAVGGTAAPAFSQPEATTTTSAEAPEDALASPMQHPSVPPLSDDLDGPTDAELREIENLEDHETFEPDTIAADSSTPPHSVADTDAITEPVDATATDELPADPELPEDIDVEAAEPATNSRWDRKGDDGATTDQPPALDDQLVSEDLVAEIPEDPSAVDPALEDPALEDPALEDPALEDPALENSVPQDAVVEDSVLEDPAEHSDTVSLTPTPPLSPELDDQAEIDPPPVVAEIPDAAFSPPDSEASPVIPELTEIPELAEIPDLSETTAAAVPPAPPAPETTPPPPAAPAPSEPPVIAEVPGDPEVAAISSAAAPPIDAPQQAESTQPRAPIPEPFPEASADDLVEAEPQKSFIRRWWLPVLLVAGALALVNFVIMPYIDTDRTSEDDSELNVFELATGTCINEVDLDTQTELKGTVERVPCTEPHSHEIFHTVSHPEGTFDSTLIREFATAECLGMFETYTGEFYSLSQLKFILLLPNEKAWDKGDRRTICALFGDGPLTESARS